MFLKIKKLPSLNIFFFYKKKENINADYFKAFICNTTSM